MSGFVPGRGADRNMLEGKHGMAKGAVHASTLHGRQAASSREVSSAVIGSTVLSSKNWVAAARQLLGAKR